MCEAMFRPVVSYFTEAPKVSRECLLLNVCYIIHFLLSKNSKDEFYRENCIFVAREQHTIIDTFNFAKTNYNQN